MSPTRKPRFQTAAGLTLPSADEAVGVSTSGSQDVVTPAMPPKSPGGRTAFTWRLTAEEALMLDDMLLRIKRQLGRPKLDRAGMLAALARLADKNSAIFGALVAEIEDEQTS